MTGCVKSAAPTLSWSPKGDAEEKEHVSKPARLHGERGGRGGGGGGRVSGPGVDPASDGRQTEASVPQAGGKRLQMPICNVWPTRLTWRPPLRMPRHPWPNCFWGGVCWGKEFLCAPVSLSLSRGAVCAHECMYAKRICAVLCAVHIVLSGASFFTGLHQLKSWARIPQSHYFSSRRFASFECRGFHEPESKTCARFLHWFHFIFVFYLSLWCFFSSWK